MSSMRSPPGSSLLPAAATAAVLFDVSIEVSVEVADECTQKLLDVVKELNGIAIVLADHGNADEMYTVKNGKKLVSTAHSLNPVPFAIIDSGYKGEYKMAAIDTPGLSNVASTIINLFGFEKPEDYDSSLIEFIKTN